MEREKHVETQRVAMRRIPARERSLITVARRALGSFVRIAAAALCVLGVLGLLEQPNAEFASRALHIFK